MISSYILISIRPGSSDKAIKEMRKINNIAKISVVAGDYDIVVRVQVKSLQDLLKVTDKIHMIDGIKKTFKLVGRTDVVVKNPDLIEKWKEIGLKMVVFGLEAIKDEGLKKLNKKNTVETNNEAIRILHNNDINVIGQLIISPESTKEDFKELEEYVERMNLRHPIFSVLTPLPETDLYYQKKDQLLTENYEVRII